MCVFVKVCVTCVCMCVCIVFGCICAHVDVCPVLVCVCVCHMWNCMGNTTSRWRQLSRMWEHSERDCIFNNSGTISHCHQINFLRGGKTINIMEGSLQALRALVYQQMLAIPKQCLIWTGAIHLQQSQPHYDSHPRWYQSRRQVKAMWAWWQNKILCWHNLENTWKEFAVCVWSPQLGWPLWTAGAIPGTVPNSPPRLLICCLFHLLTGSTISIPCCPGGMVWWWPTWSALNSLEHYRWGTQRNIKLRPVHTEFTIWFPKKCSEVLKLSLCLGQRASPHTSVLFESPPKLFHWAPVVL